MDWLKKNRKKVLSITSAGAMKDEKKKKRKTLTMAMVRNQIEGLYKGFWSNGICGESKESLPVSSFIV
jgi:hypothetical protein